MASAVPEDEVNLVEAESKQENYYSNPPSYEDVEAGVSPSQTKTAYPISTESNAVPSPKCVEILRVVFVATRDNKKDCWTWIKTIVKILFVLFIISIGLFFITYIIFDSYNDNYQNGINNDANQLNLPDPENIKKYSVIYFKTKILNNDDLNDLYDLNIDDLLNTNKGIFDDTSFPKIDFKLFDNIKLNDDPINSFYQTSDIPSSTFDLQNIQNIDDLDQLRKFFDDNYKSFNIINKK